MRRIVRTYSILPSLYPLRDTKSIPCADKSKNIYFSSVFGSRFMVKVYSRRQSGQKYVTFITPTRASYFPSNLLCIGQRTSRWYCLFCRFRSSIITLRFLKEMRFYIRATPRMQSLSTSCRRSCCRCTRLFFRALQSPCCRV